MDIKKGTVQHSSIERWALDYRRKWEYCNTMGPKTTGPIISLAQAIDFPKLTLNLLLLLSDLSLYIELSCPSPLPSSVGPLQYEQNYLTFHLTQTKNYHADLLTRDWPNMFSYWVYPSIASNRKVLS